MAPHLLRCQGIAVGPPDFTLGRLEAGAPSTFANQGTFKALNFKSLLSESLGPFHIRYLFFKLNM